jgi:2',3'-cyclic-nucleotide 2'-phosphodiesterase
MNVLFIGDIVGPDATAYVARRVPELRQQYALDLVIANGENCAISASTPWQGFGMTTELIDLLLQNGVDVITSGNHGWDGPEAEIVHQHSQVLRPFNMPDVTAGKGNIHLNIAGEDVTILNLGGKSALDEALPVYPAWLSAERKGSVIVDFHSDAAWEKMIFATAVDGTAAAVLGTHTHEPTIPLYILPGGTAYVTDVGMTSPTGSPGGFPLIHFATKYKGGDFSALPPYQMSTGEIVLGAVRLRIEGGKTLDIERIY